MTNERIVQKQLTLTLRKEKVQRESYIVQSTIFIKCKNKRRKNILEACKETFSKKKSSAQDLQ